MPLCVPGIPRRQESNSLEEQQVLLVSEPSLRLSLLSPGSLWGRAHGSTHSRHWPGVHNLPSGAHFPGSQPAPCRSGWQQSQPRVEKQTVRAAKGWGPSLLISRSPESRLSKTHRTPQRGKGEEKHISSIVALSSHVLRVFVEKGGKA